MKANKNNFKFIKLLCTKILTLQLPQRTKAKQTLWNYAKSKLYYWLWLFSQCMYVYYVCWHMYGIEKRSTARLYLELLLVFFNLTARHHFLCSVFGSPTNAINCWLFSQLLSLKLFLSSRFFSMLLLALFRSYCQVHSQEHNGWIMHRSKT